MIDTVALDPPYRPDGLPVTSMTTGNVDTFELVEARRPTDATVPKMSAVDPDTVTVAWSPTFTWLTWVLFTVELTMYEPVDTTTTWALEALEDDVAPVDATAEVPPDEPAWENPLDPVPEPVPPEDADDEPAADDVDEADELLTCWPTVRLTEATVPAMVEVRVASDTDDWAEATWVWA